jgi:serine-type anaerobic sulfatase-maturating enzyme
VTAISLIVKGTRLCNLRCVYCHDWRADRDQTMSFPVLARLIAAALSDPEHDAVEFIWHGGETTLLPRAFYEKALLVQSRFRRPGQQVHNSIQTNGTRLTPEWMHFFRANKFSVGVSLDGPPELHDRTRRYAGGRGSSQDVARGIRMLQEFQVPFGILMVIDEAALELGADRIFDYILELGVRSFGLLSCRPDNQPDAAPGTATSHYADPVRMAAFLGRIYDRWSEHGDTGIKIRELDAVRRRVSHENAGFCKLGGHCLGQFFLVEPTGEIAHCDLFLGDPRYTLGNILVDDFASIRRSPKLLALQAENEQALEAMRDCPDFGVCNGWCPHERYTSLRHNPQHSATCCGLRPLITHIREREHAAAAVLA